MVDYIKNPPSIPNNPNSILWSASQLNTLDQIYKIYNKINGKWVHLFEYGYYESPESAILVYDTWDLNRKDLDFRWAKLKNIANKISITSSWDGIEWADDNLRELHGTVNVVNSQVSIDIVDNTNIQAWEELYNRNTWETYIVTAKSTNTYTITAFNAAWDAATPAKTITVWDVLVRVNFAKIYWSNDWMYANRNALKQATNYMQFVSMNIDNDMITNNRTRLFMDDAGEMVKQQFSDASRKIIKGMAQSFYVWAKWFDSSTKRYSAWGLERFIPDSCKVNIKWATDKDTKDNLRRELTKAYQSWMTNIRGNNKLVALCTTRFNDEIDALYEGKIIYNDELSNVNVHISRLTLWSNNLNLSISNLLDETYGDQAVCFLVPVDYVFMYNVPNTVTNSSWKAIDKLGRWIIFIPPVNQPEQLTIQLFTTYSFMFGWITSWAYRKLTIA